VIIVDVPIYTRKFNIANNLSGHLFQGPSVSRRVKIVHEQFAADKVLREKYQDLKSKIKFDPY
jgi:hypothetical protein